MNDVSSEIAASMIVKCLFIVEGMAEDSAESLCDERTRESLSPRAISRLIVNSIKDGAASDCPDVLGIGAAETGECDVLFEYFGLA